MDVRIPPCSRPQDGIVLIYVDTQLIGLSGAGFIFGYTYEIGALKKLVDVMLWISNYNLYDLRRQSVGFVFCVKWVP